MSTGTKLLAGLAIFLFVVIIVMTYMLFALPAPERAENATTTPATTTTQKNTETPNQPLSARVSVTSPKPNATVGSTFVVAGSAPGNWFFEADFPIQIRDKDGNVLARTYASAQGDWMTTELVTFTSTIHLDSPYKGAATLILLRNNPSGLPENDDAVEVPIVIQ